MAEAVACLECLHRSWLLAALGPYVEKVATGEVGSRSPELLRLSNEDLIEVAAPKVATQMLTRLESLSEKRLVEELLLAECWACCRHGDLYPDSLRDAADAPWALIGRGDPRLLDGLDPFGAVTIVGARRATSYGREIARELGRELASAGMVVVSGLAFGIDACAHRGAIDVGRTIAVLGCGPDVAYPASHRSLWRQICERGLVISEFPPGATPWRWTFPARNRIMAALAGMTVVVEAATRSGSLITTDLAADLGRDLGAVPGPVTSRASAGPNALLASGAHVVRDAQDVLDALLGPGQKKLEPVALALDPDLGAVLAAVEAGNSTCDAVATATGLSGPAAAAALSRLELLGYLTCSNMGTYLRTLAPSPRSSSL
ncbi:MAG TPA: DNA-processing protein DprA [Solirubrobacterales bacterium]|jgi:DNA processing protein|nr:DNA-processing protein DprA [Solirubrobacterales bacterium]